MPAYRSTSHRPDLSPGGIDYLAGRSDTTPFVAENDYVIAGRDEFIRRENLKLERLGDPAEISTESILSAPSPGPWNLCGAEKVKSKSSVTKLKRWKGRLRQSPGRCVGGYEDFLARSFIILLELTGSAHVPALAFVVSGKLAVSTTLERFKRITMDDQDPSAPPVEARMYELIFGFMAVPAIGVAARLRIPDLIADSAMTVEELAGPTNADAPSLRRLLRFLASLGIFVEDGAGKFRHTPLSESLRSGAPQSLGGLATMLSSEYMWRPWGDLHHAVLTGEPGFDRVHGASILEYLAAHPDELAIRNAAMTSISSVELPQILAAYDFSQFECVADLGGGHGALLHGILSKHPTVRGILADLPVVVAGATLPRSKPVAERCEIIGVDLFERVPAGADGYLMKYIVHGFNDKDALKIIKNCRQMMNLDAKLLLIERVLKPANQPDPGKFMDLQMLVVAPGGRERTEADYQTLLHEGGFFLERVIPTTGPLSIIESRPL